MSPPELTPERIGEIKVLLGVAGFLIGVIVFPFVAAWWFERQNRIMRSASQFWCHRCRRGTDWSEDRKRCLECTEDA